MDLGLVSYNVTVTKLTVTLWLFSIAMENGPFIVYLPSKNGWIFPVRYVNVYQRVTKLTLTLW